jgi:hypothetical protein
LNYEKLKVQKFQRDFLDVMGFGYVENEDICGFVARSDKKEAN